MNNNEIIRFSSLSKMYDKHVGISNLDFSIKEGEVFGFLGPNGAGKTTTIRLMLDLLKPSGGSVHIFGKDVKNASLEIRKRLGYLPGDFSPYDRMTGNEFLKFSSNLRQINYSKPTILLDTFELSDRDLNKKIRAYSQGMKQKLGIIQAVSHRPELIILDEPSTGLDPLMQDALYELLLGLNSEGSTIFFSSHNLPEVEKICKKVAIVKEGKLVGFESLESLRQKITKKLILKLPLDVTAAPQLQGADLISNNQNIFEYRITGELNSLFAQLARFRIEDLILPAPSLEDIFLSFYDKNQKKKTQ
jgi:ABC-2 type transport system ATP-binding protein